MARFFARMWREWFRSMLVIVLVVTSLRSAVADWNDVPTGSMRPTILEGDRIFVNKLAYDLRVPYTRWRIATWDHPRRGDIVVLDSPTDGKRLVKRVVGLPGDSIAVLHGTLVVNGRAVEYSPVDPGLITDLELDEPLPIVATEELDEAPHAVLIAPRTTRRNSVAAFTVPIGHYFVMGDNRAHSLDSRHFGAVERKLIVGRATAVAASVNPERHYLPRWSRFLKALR